jgi:flagellar biosynthetic protein FlhB
MLVAMTVFVWLIAPMTMVRLQGYLQRFLEEPHTMRIGNTAELETLISDLISHIGLVMVVPFAFLLSVGLSVTIWQTGWMISTKKITPDLNKLNPLTGLGRMFSINSVIELSKSVAKLVVVGAICYMVLKPRVAELELLPSMEMAAILAYLHQVLVRLIFAVALSMLVVAVADWFYQRYAYLKKLKMTKQEVKDENKQSEGDPAIKARLRGLRMARARNRMMRAVPKADVVVTNPTHYACALKYDGETMNAPTLVAKGQNLIALRIREIAEENGVPIVENPPLARALFATVDLDREIPPDHYKAVAEVISYVMRLKGKYRR